MIPKFKAALFILLSSIFISVQEPTNIRIFTIGDSTVQNYNSGWFPRTGWGQVLHHFFDQSSVEVINRAVGGTSSRSFYNNHWSGVKAGLQAGDYVFIQFGINDRAADAERKTNETEFKEFLRLYVSETRDKGAIPVLVSTVRRDAWQNGIPYDSYHEHPRAVRAVALELGLPCIDLDTRHKELMIKVGSEYSKYYLSNTYDPGDHPNYPNGNTDQVHFQENGAVELANAIVEEIIRQKDSADLKLLYNYLAPQYDLKIHTSDSTAGTITRRTTLPAGTPITLRVRPNEGNVFLKWRNLTTNTDISNDKIEHITMTDDDLEIVGFFNEIISIGCDGEFATGASLDVCGVCSGGSTGIPAYTCDAYGQPETCADGFGSEGDGFTGDGYLQSADGNSSIYQLSFTSSTAFTDQFAFKYSNGSEQDLKAQMFINGNFLGSVSFPSTKGWFDWNLFLKDIFISEDENLLEIKATSELGLPYIDLVMWHNKTLKMECIAETELSTSDNSIPINIFPNPFIEGFKISGVKGQFSIYNLSGEKVESGRLTNDMIGVALYPGIYVIQINGENGDFSGRIIKE